MLDVLEQNTAQIKGVKYTLTMNYEDVQEQNQSRIDLIAASYPDLYRAYQLNERLRIILHLKDPIWQKRNFGRGTHNFLG